MMNISRRMSCHPPSSLAQELKKSHCTVHLLLCLMATIDCTVTDYGYEVSINDDIELSPRWLGPREPDHPPPEHLLKSALNVCQTRGCTKIKKTVISWKTKTNRPDVRLQWRPRRRWPRRSSTGLEPHWVSSQPSEEWTHP